jgi:Fe-Mn family superoxide dismutase
MSTQATTSAPLTLPPLPYAESALEPVISAKTLSFHHGKHHRAYVENTNKLIAGTELADLPLDRIVTLAAGADDRANIFNNAAQAWNHCFYWHCLSPKGGGEPPMALRHKMEETFDSVVACEKELANIALSQFGSGWAWLVLEDSKLKVVKTANANTPLTAPVSANPRPRQWCRSRIYPPGVRV